MTTERSPKSDKELWRRLAYGDAAGREGAPATVSDLDFAAWLEGRLPESAAARIEAAVAADSQLRHAALELADILGKPLPAAPPRLEARAKALVGFEVERQSGPWTGRPSLLDWLFASGQRFVLQRAVALTAAVVVAVSGFMLGGGLGESLAQERYVSSASSSAAASNSSSNDLTEFLGSDGI